MTIYVHKRFQQKREPRPKKAEQLNFSTYLEETSVPSKIVKGLFNAGPSIFHCPRCHSHGEEPYHGDRFDCTDCGLHMEVYGNSLYIWT